ncbi:DUF3037 domain-containing protein [Exiguobacterium profundum]|uniref:DUF3037 domain-containing protein n=1 Tax=Exiguobacterium profundum TaxID=307643 RepID=UPI0029C3984F|nr:DUF3037 domain-containing protein [Exiguobacterium profundum]MDX5982235.1 DUF3037 domain-containing protein [Exiguobacterium profundum]
MEKRITSKLRYSIIRYTPDTLAGETLNVGLIMHSCHENVFTRFEMLSPSSPKLKYHFHNTHIQNEYKSFMNVYEYYFSHNEDLTGNVHEFSIAPIFSEDYLDKIYEETKFSKFFFTQPKVARSSNMDRLFNSLYAAYVDPLYNHVDEKKITVRKHMRNLFIENGVWETKILKDKLVTPIEDLNNFQVKIDYSFKNGVWNYLQAMPSDSSHAKTVDWFAKTKMLVENLSDSGEVIHLVYHSSDFENEHLQEILNYLENMDKERVNKIDLNDNQVVNALLLKVQNEAHDIQDLAEVM